MSLVSSQSTADKASPTTELVSSHRRMDAIALAQELQASHEALTSACYKIATTLMYTPLSSAQERIDVGKQLDALVATAAEERREAVARWHASLKGEAVNG